MSDVHCQDSVHHSELVTTFKLVTQHSSLFTCRYLKKEKERKKIKQSLFTCRKNQKNKLVGYPTTEQGL
jgi:TnpA family transposase